MKSPGATPRIVSYAACILTWSLGGPVQAAPKDGQQLEKSLEEAYEACHHWGGEEPDSVDREKEIETGINRDCGAALKEAENALAIRGKSAKVAALILRIADSAPKSGDAVTQWKNRAPELCGQAETYFAGLKPADDPDAQSTVISYCPLLATKIYKKK